MVSARCLVLFLLSRGVGCTVPCEAGDSCHPVADGVDVNLLQTAVVVDIEAHDQQRQDDDFETLVNELAYLAGGVASNLGGSLRDTMGWTAGTTVSDTNNVTGSIDTMQVYTSASACAVAFSATDDLEDNAQQMLGATQPVEFCGFPDVNGGYAQEMGQYMAVGAWRQALKELGGCAQTGKTIYATGHSMGGAMASLFAACVNTGADFPYKNAFGGGQFPEINLVTFGAPGPSRTPLYNGEEGNCFTGTRRYVHEEPTAAPKQFHVDNLNNFARLATTIGQATGNAELTAAGPQLSGAAAKLETLPYPSAHATGLVQQASSNIGSMWLIAFNIMSNATIPGMEALVTLYPTFQQAFQTTITTHITSLMYNYDPVPQLFDFAGYRHPLMRVEPQPHSARGGGSIAAIECEDGSGVPNEDYAQLFWGLILANSNSAGGTSFPNHNLCCMVADTDCNDRFDPPLYGLHCTDMWAPIMAMLRAAAAAGA